MPQVNASNYTTPGIYVNQFDNSQTTSVTVQGIVNTVIGVSRKGPVNKPILIQNTTDLQNNFGAIDRNLERKGSFFHRTIAQMIQSSPVYAINLLATDDTLDTIEYAPISTSTDKTNDTIKTGPYSRFFNRTGFWKRDADSFLTLAQTNPNYANRLLDFTNMGSNYITVFVFKSTITGYDRTMVDYYGAIEKIPTYVYPTDYVSDYMVDVVVVAGDWSNYETLSVDARWSKYFDATGLRKEQVTNFYNDTNVTSLKFYQGLSFIPYFRNLQNQIVFIETVINQDTDITGLFCTIDSDAIEADYPNGKIDLVGNNLVTTDELIDAGLNSINFLSYNDKLTEDVTFLNTILDRPANVVALDPTASFRTSVISNDYRTDWYAEGIVEGITFDNTVFNTSTFSAVNIQYDWNGIGDNGNLPYAIIGGNKVNINATASFTINASDYGSFSTTQSYYAAYKLDTSGNITTATTTTPGVFPSVASTDIVLGYVNLNLHGGKITTHSFSHVNVNASSYLDLKYGINFTVTSLGSNTFKVTFLNTASLPSTSSYAQYNSIKRFNAFRTILESANVGYASLLVDMGNGYEKRSLSGMTVGPIVVSNTSNKSFTIATNFGMDETLFNTIVIPSLQYSFVLYAMDNEQIFSDYTMITTNSCTSSLTGTSSYGIVSKNSTIYKDFYNGDINTGDYFYANINEYTNNINLITSSGSSYIVITGTNSGAPFDVETYRSISIPSSNLNTGTLTITDATNHAAALGYSASYHYAYNIEQSLTTEALTDVTTVYDMSNKYYLAMYMDTSNNLTVNITDNTLVTPNLMGSSLLALNQSINVISDIADYKESIEIVIPTNYVQVANKILIKGSRYNKVNVGDFLEAYVDITTLADGQVAKRLTRIISKKVYSADTTLVEITCDATIALYNVGSGYQTMKYSTLDNYVTTYKAITLKGFRLREACLPDGTETRQSNILSLVSMNTPLFRAITNKEAFDFRYLIDSFGLGLTERSKQPLVDICGARLDCLGIISAPSMKSFRKSNSPSFVDAQGVLQTSFVAKGGDPDSNPAFLYSFGDGDGASAVGYFTPYVGVNDNGRPIEVPPAMFVATTYMRKQNSNITGVYAWTIAAGTTDGRILNIANVEMDFDPEDVKNLNGAKFNPIVVKRNKGFVIDSENTALTLYTSALSYLHVREMLIELERQIISMLQDFQWKFNTPEVRSDVKLRADSVCTGIQSKKGMYMFACVCNDTNNPPSLIESQIGVLDIQVEPIMGLGIIVANITVMKTGAIQSSGFAAL